MRTLIIGTLVILIASTISCNKSNPFVDKKGPLQIAGKSDDTVIPYSAISLTNGLLEFDDMDAFVQTLTALENRVDNWTEDFMEAYTNLEDEELNDFIDSIGFKEEQPLINFEANFSGFASLRHEIFELEDYWLENDGENIEDDPDNHFIMEDELRSVLNVHSEVKIGGSIYKFTGAGYVEVTDGSFSTLLELREDINYSAENIFRDMGCNDTCATGKTKADFAYNIERTRRIKWRVSHRTYPWPIGRYVKAQTKNYRKVGSRWRRYSVEAVAMVYGNVSGSSGDCSNTFAFNTAGAYASKKSKVVRHKINVPTCTKSTWVLGYHIGAEGVAFFSVLVWI